MDYVNLILHTGIEDNSDSWKWQCPNTWKLV